MSYHSINQTLYKDLPYDPAKFVPVTVYATLPNAIAGRVDIFIGNIYAGLRFQQAGKVKFLGVADTQRSPVVPGIPTVGEAGLPGFVAIAWFALVAPPGTPAAIAQGINAAVVEVLKLPEVQKRFLDQGLTPVGNSPAEAAAFISDETARWQGVIRKTNIRLE